MRRIRARLAGIAAGILLLQVMASAVSSISACCQDPPAAAGMKCCREGGTNHICPLMKQGADAPRCQMRACGTRHDDGIPFSAFIGLLIPKTAFVLQPRAMSSFDIVASPLRRAPIPPSPPPRQIS